MDKLKILLVEDEQALAMIICDTLQKVQMSVDVAHNGEEGLRAFFRLRPDVVVADVMMPRLDGFEMVKRLRQQDKQVPVIFLTARSAVDDVVKGFELGADDYLKKPFSMKELIVRIKALAARANRERQDAMPATELCYTLGAYRFYPERQRLEHHSMTQLLSHRESEILLRLVQNKGQVVHMRDILLEFWGDDTFFNTRSLQVFLTKLRHKLSKDPDISIINVRGIGYKLLQK